MGKTPNFNCKAIEVTEVNSKKKKNLWYKTVKKADNWIVFSLKADMLYFD